MANTRGSKRWSATKIRSSGTTLPSLSSPRAPSPEERRRVYVILKPTVKPLADGGLKMSGAFGEEGPTWETAGTSRRSFPDANPATPTRLRFTIIPKDTGLKTAFKLDYNVRL